VTDIKSQSPNEPAKKSYKVFVVSPIGSAGTETHRKAKYALEYVIRKALPEPGWEVHRADEGASPGSISHHVIDNIAKADLVVTDLTDHNPNVFYELAIAHGWKKPVVHIIEQGQKVPFDIIDQRTISYDLTDLASVHAAIGSIKKAAIWALDNAEELVTPMRQYEMFSVASGDPTKASSLQALQFDELFRRISGIERSLHVARSSQEIAIASQEIPLRLEVAEEFAELSRAFEVFTDGPGMKPDQVREFHKTQHRLIHLWSSFSDNQKKAVSRYLDNNGIDLPFML